MAADTYTETLHGIKITFPPDALDLIREVYSKSKNILEYGSGGSTALALENDVERIVSVESDKEWAREMNRTLSKHYDPHRFLIHHANIVPTTNWGYPKGPRSYPKFHLYPTQIWDLIEDWHPDTVLIDGRFRAACFITTLLRIKKPVTVLFDDYKHRTKYHFIEDFAKPTLLVGRVAIFEIEPRDFPIEKLTTIISAYAQTN